MVPPPFAMGLTVCEQVIVAHATLNVSVINGFNRLRAEEFPFTPRMMCAFSTLTGGQGEAEITLTLTDLESDEEVHSWTRRVAFPDRFTEVHVVFRLTACQFPGPGAYMFTLQVDDDWVAHRRITIIHEE